jgi:hypothetical protein
LGLVHSDVCGPMSSVPIVVFSISLLLPMTLVDMDTSN